MLQNRENLNRCGRLGGNNFEAKHKIDDSVVT